MRSTRGSLLAAAWAAIVACGLAPAAAEAANATVNISDYHFVDAASGTSLTTINVGDTVTWDLTQGSHSTTSGTCTSGGGGGGCNYGCSPGTCTPNGDWDSGVLSSGSYSRTFTTAGTYHYFCSVHGTAMEGQVIVNAAVPTSCTPDANTLCLNGGRFMVQVQWTDFQGNTGAGNVVPGVSSDSSGLFWFFSPDNWEMLIKVLDGCGIDGHYWVFGAASTNVQYTIQVTDTQTGLVKTYSNPLGTQSPAITDTAAFASCP